MINFTGKIDLSLIPNPDLQERAQHYWDNKDIEGVFCMMSNRQGLNFVCINLPVLLKAGLYEKALLSAFTNTDTNWSHWPEETLNLMFTAVDREKMLLCGDPLPGEGPIIVYRGVSGVGEKRRVRGISWTSSFDTAKFFSNRFKPMLEFENPAIYQLSVSKEDIYAYDNSRSAEEYLIDMMREHIKPIKVWGPEMEDSNNLEEQSEGLELITN